MQDTGTAGVIHNYSAKVAFGTSDCSNDQNILCNNSVGNKLQRNYFVKLIACQLSLPMLNIFDVCYEQRRTGTKHVQIQAGHRKEILITEI